MVRSCRPGARSIPDVQIVGVVEPDDQLFQKYATRYHWPAAMRFRSIEDLASGAHPQANLIFTPTAGHTQAVIKSAALGIHVMMEKPMAVSYKDALAMAEAACGGVFTCSQIMKPLGMQATRLHTIW